MKVTDNKTSKIEVLIGMLSSERKFPADFLENLQAWLIDRNESAEDKDIVLEGFFDRLIQTYGGNEYAVETWPELVRKLGIVPGPAKRPETHAVSVIPSRTRLIRNAAAAVFVCLTIVSAFLLVKQWSAEYRGASSAQFSVRTSAADNTVLLPDGSVVAVRDNTSLSYSANFMSNRSVAIDGEAFFTIAPYRGRRFTVEGRDIRAVVESTEFNMRAFDEENIAEVTLLTGSVTVASGGRNVTLKPGEKMSVDRERGAIEMRVASGGELSRLRGTGLLLQGVTLGEALASVGSYFGVEMDIPARLPRIDGIVLDLGREATLEDALFLLRVINPVFNYHIENSAVSIIVGR